MLTAYRASPGHVGPDGRAHGSRQSLLARARICEHGRVSHATVSTVHLRYEITSLTHRSQHTPRPSRRAAATRFAGRMRGWRRQRGVHVHMYKSSQRIGRAGRRCGLHYGSLHVRPALPPRARRLFRQSPSWPAFSVRRHGRAAKPSASWGARSAGAAKEGEGAHRARGPWC